MRTSGLLRGARRWLRVAAVSLALALCGCATQLPGADFPKPPSYALSQPAGTLLGNQYYNHGGAQAADRSGFKVLPRGLDGLAMRAQLIAVAEKTVDVQYYIFDEDQTGHLLVDGLLRAADRGVRVRVLIDDGDAAGRDALIGSLDAHPNIEVRVFNPFSYRGSLKILRGLEFAFNASRLDYRMHNKLFVVDNAAALAGGRNVANEYFQVSPQYQLGDYDVFAAGPIVARLSRTFDEFWNSRLAIPVEALHGPTPETEFQAYRDRIRQDVAKMEATRSDVLGRVRSGEPLHALLSGA